MSAAKMSADALLHMAKTRRTIYALNKTLPVPAARIRELVHQTTLHTPSSFNSQTNRVVVLLGAEHDALRAVVPDDRWQATAARIAGFRAAAGSALFFSDDAVKDVQARFPTYADRFASWADQSNGMQQWLLWTALELEGLGASLQHYSPLIDQKVAATWSIPVSWKLNAQLVFGGKEGEAGEKQFQPVDDRVKFFGEA